MPRTIPALAALSTVIIAGTPHAPPDLDVGIPPGSPTQWGQRFPAITPRDQPLLPLTGETSVDDPTRTVARRELAGDLDVQMADTFGILRILTWDVGGHLPWVNVPSASRPPVTGAARSEAALPAVGSALHWTSAAALLRLLLHPQLVSQAELIAHLVEIGEPTLGIVDAARVEPALREVCEELVKRVDSGRRAVRPLLRPSHRATTLSRFVHDELLETFPYDPEGGFGRRMFLFSHEVEPLLIAYARHEDSLLRRNAVAALARYRTPDASNTLLRTAVLPDDPVAQMRALAAMDDRRVLRAPDVLLQRLRLSRDRVEQVALIQAVGRVRLEQAVPTLLELGTGRDVDPDLLLAVVMALVRIGPGGDADVGRFADSLAAQARGNPERFAVGRGEPAPAADRPDSPRTRGEVLAQLAVLLQARLRGDAAAVVGLSQGPARGGRGAFANAAISGVHPPAQMLYLDTLYELGLDGHEPALTVAADRTVEPALRGHALALLPTRDRAKLAVEILESTVESDEMKIYAVEVLGADGHKRLRELAGPLLAKCAEVGDEVASPERRYLWLSALRALERGGLLATADLLPLLARVASPRNKTAVIDTIRALVGRLVADAADGLTRSELRDRVDEILTVVIEHALNDMITEDTRAGAREQLRNRLLALRSHRADTGYQGLVTRDVLRYLLGFQLPDRSARLGEFAPPVLLEEEILLALGRSGTPEAEAALATFLQEQKDNPFRAEACLAVGETGNAGLARDLVPYLLDEDGFVRFCAYEGLRHLTAEDFWVDWIYGEPAERGAAAEQWYRWSIRKR